MLLISLLISLVIFIIFITCKIFNKLTIGMCRSNVTLVGKTALITGGNSGIGYYTALGLAARGCRVIMASRNNTEEIRNKIIEHTHNPNIIMKYVDFISLDSVRELAKDIIATEERLDILINNSGTFGLGNSKTKDGLHLSMQVNHFASFLLTHLLTDLLKKSAPSRIIFTSSIVSFAHNLTVDNLGLQGDDSITSDILAYANSKLCNIITSNGYAEKFKDSGVTVNSLHPGVVNTGIIQRYNSLTVSTFLYTSLDYFFYKSGLISRTAYEGSQTLLKLSISNNLRNVTGKFFLECKSSHWFTPPIVRNKEFCAKIWKESERLLKIGNDV